MKLEVTDVRELARGIESFTLTRPDDGPLPPFEPGAHLLFELDLPDGRRLERQYSIVSDPNDRSHYSIAVLLEEHGRGGSRFFHTQVAKGNHLEVSEPRNEFSFVPDAKHSVLVAGGIGITPILPMVRRLEQLERSYELHYAAKTEQHMAFRDELAALGRKSVHFYFTARPKGSRPDLKSILAASETEGHVYVCGPREMIRDTRQLATSLGWADKRIHFESFGAKKHPRDRPITVELARSERTLEVETGQTILDAMLEAGLWASYDCKRGECATCMTPVLSGEPDHRDVCLNDEARERHICTCVSRAKGDKLVLDF